MQSTSLGDYAATRRAPSHSPRCGLSAGMSALGATRAAVAVDFQSACYFPLGSTRPFAPARPQPGLFLRDDDDASPPTMTSLPSTATPTTKTPLTNVCLLFPKQHQRRRARLRQ